MKNVPSLNRVLVIDDIPVIAFGLLHTLIPLNPAVSVSYESNILSSLSLTSNPANAFDLVIKGVLPGHSSKSLWKSLTHIKKTHPDSQLMLYGSYYSHKLIEQMEQLGIDAYVHRYDPIEEIQKAYLQLASGKKYISSLFYALYNDYC